MNRVVQSKSVRRRRAGFGELPPGVIMLTLWLIGMALFLSLALSLYVVASVLTKLYAGS